MSELTIARASWRDFLEMTKPRVVLLMLLCALVGMFLAVPGMVPVDVLVFGLTGIALVAGSAAVVNHIADAQIDKRMARTRERPVATGRVDTRSALMFSAVTGVAGMLILYLNAERIGVGFAWIHRRPHLAMAPRGLSSQAAISLVRTDRRL